MKTNIFAHRGASKYAPENTMPAFQKAYHMNADGIETDVQLTKDNIPVLIHDENVKRTTNSVGLVSKLSYQELKELDAGSWFSPEFKGIKIPTLDEFLNWIKDKPLYLNIELKNNKIDYTDIESIVYQAISNYQLLNRTTISTFNPNSVKRLKEYSNSLEVAFLTSKRYKSPIRVAKELGANALHLKYRLLHRELVENIHKENMKLRIYTVNKPVRIMRSFNHQVDGIFTDVPDLAFHYRESVTD
ncbi:MAG: glycerophosphodiester phosphodiesterase [Bacillota bacterium]|uniref:glycerophosphodiester phosphodiesterase n=1 Tax=Virgibacillus TaxID=84406 RepID=UPI0004168041|nr:MULTISPECIES: glycerophosphodiester phosphodiesterase [Bacillaceae]MCC2249151.1 glycerophosphodiester phosphodiesterase [Virgibacillus sp. AGTR]MDY7043453.1 glycerophosphodiester phosphodiesterase [Virgibacillus sp. M23]WBX79202.1 glycerophosphodiester phosphodiesterase [Virgibacillus salarius]